LFYFWIQMSFSPIIRVRKLLDKMKSERASDSSSPRLHNKRFHRRDTSDGDLSGSQLNFSSPNTRPKKSAKKKLMSSLELINESKQEITGEDHFMYLPIEATLLIFSFLEKEDLETIAFVSKMWNYLSNDENLWKQLCIQDWNIEVLHDKSWKRTYNRIQDVLSDGVWEGMSKWIDPVGFDNEQRTTARLCFQKRTSRLRPVTFSNINGGLTSPTSSPSVSSKAEIHRCASTTNPNQLTSTVNLSPSSSSNLPLTSSSSQDANSDDNSNEKVKEAELRVHGSGVTVNCAAPSLFKIEGERLLNDDTGSSFQWNKLFERHTSVYNGRINFMEASVIGTIAYHDGTTHWKGEFQYKKNRSKKISQLNA